MPRRDRALDIASPVEAEECWMVVDGIRMRYLRVGSGPPLVLLHGLLGYSFSWRFNMDAFAEHRTVYAVDMPGAGLSGRSMQLDVSFRGSALRVLRFADQLGLERFDLLGTSHGGAVASLATAIGNEQSSARVQRLILVAPVNPWSAHGRQLAALVSGPLMSGLLGHSIVYCRFAHRLVVRRLYGDARRIAPGTVEGYSKPYRVPGSFEHLFKILRSWKDDLKDLENSLAKLGDLPVLLLWGDQDTAVNPDSAPRLARCFRDANLVILPGVGHLPYEEVPQEFNAAVLKFLLAL